MKRKIMISGIFVLGMFMLLSSCKKSDADVKENASGTFHAFEAIIGGKTVTLPTDNEAIDIKISMLSDEAANVDVTYYADDKPQQAPTIQCKLETDADGFPVLKESQSGDILVLYYDSETLDFYGGGGTVSASKNGKKPSWWDEE